MNLPPNYWRDTVQSPGKADRRDPPGASPCPKSLAGPHRWWQTSRPVLGLGFCDIVLKNIELK